MKIKYIVLVLSACLFTFSACDVNLLNIPQKGVEDESNYYITDEDCESAIAAVYNSWREAFSGSGSGASFYANGFFMKNFMADDFNSGGVRSDQTYAQEFVESCVTPTNGWVENYYKKLYSTVYLCNLVIEKFDSSESAIKARDIAEAKFYRALCYFELTTLWGTPPLVDKVLKNSEEYMAANSTQENLWKFIETDLKNAIETGKLTSKSSLDDKDSGTRATLEAAETLLGKSYLFQQKYAEAKIEFEKVISSGKYGLVDDIRGFYHAQCNGCKEYVLECVRHNDPSNMYKQGGWRGILANWGFGYGFIAGPESSNYYNFNITSGYGYFNPSKSLYDAFINEEGANGYRLTNWIKTWNQVVAMNIAVNARVNKYGNEGYYRLKWLSSLEDEYVGYWCGNQSNTPVIRYADVLLMMAEACLQTNDQEGADKYVKYVRDRAKLPVKSNVTLADIKLERRLELSMEGLRFQDLKRWGDAATVLVDKGKKLPTFQITPDSNNDISTTEGIYVAQYTTKVTYVDNENNLAGWTSNRDEYLPFPENELEVNTNLKQNVGY
ncbi:MAG: RagB/SusD family nutrient uptake outer membrane protein [Bacteroides sp.]|jgi:hypothetical protein|nr:RagB/SusD family nutrient uptake outer membrane protein [Bacteroides sp.]